MNIGFTIIVTKEKIDIKTFGIENNPFIGYAETNMGFIAFAGRLYYKDDLYTSLNGKLSAYELELAKSDDLMLFINLYTVFGATVFERIEGDFSFVLWDKSSNKIYGGRDPLGGFPLFWTKERDYIAVGTSLKQLSALQKTKQLNIDYLAEFLSAPGPVQELASNECIYKSIFRICPGEIWEINVQSLHIRLHRFWNWVDHIETIKSSSIEEIGQEYRNRFYNAVKERTKGLCLAHMSGGMDSTSVSLLAKQAVAAGYGEMPLNTVSLVYNKLLALHPETEYIESVLNCNSDIIAHKIIADNILDFDSFKSTYEFDEPYAGICRLTMDCAPVDLAAKICANTVLSGIGSDEIHDIKSFDIANLFKRGKFISGWKEAVKTAYIRNCNAWAIIEELDCLPRLCFSKNTNPPWLRKDFLKLHYNNMKLPEVDSMNNLNDRSKNAVEMLKYRSGDVVRWYFAAPKGIMTSHPFLDCRLLSLGLGILNSDVKLSECSKPILACSMKDILPPQIAFRKAKSHFEEVYFLGLSKNFKILEALICEADIDYLEIFDKNLIIENLREASYGISASYKFKGLDNALSLIHWLNNENSYVKNAGNIKSKTLFIQ